jgi:polysaccharide deacetylase 2 family uncharacterized protein YibQ
LASDGDGDTDSDSKTNPDRTHLYAQIATGGLIVVTVIGIFLWLEFAATDLTAELRALRPQLNIKISALRRTAKSDGAQSSREAGASAPSRKSRIPRSVSTQTAVLHPHPDPKLIEKTDTGPLPIIGEDGRQPWRVYSRPLNVLEKRPRVAIIVTGLGVSFDATQSALEQLPGGVTFAFAPFTEKLKEWIDAARGAGHEVLLDLPMEPKGFPRNDAGPFGLLTSLQPDQNQRRLEWVLSRITGYIGVTNYRGGRFSGNKTAMQPVLAVLKRRGLMFIDSMENAISTGPAIAAALKLPTARASRIIDRVASRAAIAKQLAEIARIAKVQGVAVIMARPYPVTIRALKRWISKLDDMGLVLAPVSAVANRQKSR